jgi:hypothetical protein
MIEFIDKGFNELFLTEISRFDSGKYAYDTFFNCEWERFWIIAQSYESQFGSGAYDYMMKTMHSWKSGYVKPNSSSTYNIIACATSTFSIEEKFVEAYTQLAKHIKNGFPKIIQLKDVNKTFEQIIEKIDSFNLEKTSYYSKNIYKGNQLAEFQEYVQNIFMFYTKTIFDNLNKDLELFVKTYKNINTSFMTTSFNTYLYNIEIGLHNVVNKNYELKRVFELDHPISFEKLLNNKIGDYSLERVMQIAKASDTIKIDALLTENEIDKIVSRKKEIESLKNKGTIMLTLKTNSGILKINLRILSPNEKAMIFSRVLVFMVAVPILANYCIVQTSSFFYFAVGMIVLSFLLTPIYIDIINLTKDIFKSKE